MNKDNVEAASAVQSVVEEKIRGMKDKANHTTNLKHCGVLKL